LFHFFRAGGNLPKAGAKAFYFQGFCDAVKHALFPTRLGYGDRQGQNRSLINSYMDPACASASRMDQVDPNGFF
jgi:hypothetical protein